jgi:hypothetical protein
MVFRPLFFTSEFDIPCSIFDISFDNLRVRQGKRREFQRIEPKSS